jgi:hypothetical protein
MYVGMMVSLSHWRPPQRGLDAARPERGGLGGGGASRGGGSPGLQGAQRPKLGETPRRGPKPLPQSAGVRSRVRLKSRPVAVDQKGETVSDIKPRRNSRSGSQERREGEGLPNSDCAGDRV